jgi:hypothetical protein
MDIITHSQKAIRRHPELVGHFYVEVDRSLVAARHLPDDLKPGEIVAWKCQAKGGRAWHPITGWLPIEQFMASKRLHDPVGDTDTCFPTAVFRVDSLYRRATLDELMSELNAVTQ